MPQIVIDLNDGGYWINEAGSSTASGEYFADPAFIAVGNAYPDIGVSKDMHAWMRFVFPYTLDDITITSAYLQYTKWRTYGPTANKIQHRVYAHAHDDSPTPTDGADANSFPLTTYFSPTSSTYQDYLGNFNADQSQLITPQLANVLFEVLDRPGWAANNHICFLFKYFTLSEPTYTSLVGPALVTSLAKPQLVVDFEWNTPLPTGYDKHVEHTLTFTQSVFGRNLSKQQTDVLTFEQEIAYTRIHGRVVEHTLNIQHDVHIPQTYEREVTHLVIPMPEQSYAISRVMAVEHQLFFEQEIIRNAPNDKQLKDELVFVQDIDVARSYNRTVESVLSFTQDILSGTKNKSVVHGLQFIQEIDWEGTFAKPKTTQSTLTFNQDIDVGGVYNRGLEHQLFIRQSILGYIDGGSAGSTTCSRPDLVYSPTISPSEPTLTPSDTITLECNSDTLDLPAPLMGDREELLITRIQRRTRGGDLKTFSDEDWAKVRTFRYKFDSLDYTKVLEAYTFMANHLGLQMRLTDHEGRQWDGYIVNPQGETGQFFRMCGQTYEFDFDGVEVVS